MTSIMEIIDRISMENFGYKTGSQRKVIEEALFEGVKIGKEMVIQASVNQVGEKAIRDIRKSKCLQIKQKFIITCWKCGYSFSSPAYPASYYEECPCGTSNKELLGD